MSFQRQNWRCATRPSCGNLDQAGTTGCPEKQGQRGDHEVLKEPLFYQMLFKTSFFTSAFGEKSGFVYLLLASFKLASQAFVSEALSMPVELGSIRGYTFGEGMTHPQILLLC